MKRVCLFLAGWLFYALPSYGQAPEPSSDLIRAATVRTDKVDYQPGETADIQGSDFHPNEPIRVQVLHADGTKEGGSGHEPWFVFSDEQGKFSTQWLVSQDDSSDSSFVVTADCDHGLHAELRFTDQTVIQTFTVNIFDSGWYRADGFHGSTNNNYYVGQELWCCVNNHDFPMGYRDFFAFNLPSITGTILSATLYANNSTVGAGTPRTFTLFDVSTAMSTLLAGGTGLGSIYTDLGSGTSYGSVTLSSVAVNPVVVTLNAQGLAAIQSKLGNQFAIGGSYPGSGGDTIFWYSGWSFPPVQLVFQIERTFTDTTLSLTPATGPFGGSALLEAVLKAGTTGVAGRSVSFSLNGSPVGSATTDATGTARRTVSVAGINAGAYPSAVSATFSGDSQFAGSSGTGSLTVSQATPTLTWSSPSAIPYGTALGPSQLNASANVAGSFVYVPPAGTILNAGTNQTLQVTFTPASSNFQSATTSVLINVTSATPTIHVTAANTTYTGLSYTGATTCSADGMNGENPAATLSFEDAGHLALASAPTNAGNYFAKCAAGGSGNYAVASATAAFAIGVATPTIHVTAANAAYSGLPYVGLTSCSAEGVNGETPAAALSYQDSGHVALAGAPTNAQSYFAKCAAGGSGNYAAASATAAFTIEVATPTIHVTAANATYTGLVYAGLTSCDADGVNGETPAAVLSYLDSGHVALAGAPTNAGNYFAKCGAGGIGNYAGASATAAFVAGVSAAADALHRGLSTRRRLARC